MKELSGIAIEDHRLASDPEEYRLRQPVPTTPEGVVIPPDTSLACREEECKSRKDKETCLIARHHLHSTEPIYVAGGPTAEEFRDLPTLTVWLLECRHDEHHSKHEIEVPIPFLEVMKEVIEEEKKIRQLITSQRELHNIAKILNHPSTTQRQKKGLRRRENTVLHNRLEEIDSVKTIQLIPEELITGALLIAAPNHARSRILMGGRFVLPGIITRQEIPIAQRNAQTTINLAA